MRSPRRDQSSISVLFPKNDQGRLGVGVGARPKKWEGTGWGVVSEEEPGWTVLFRSQLLRFFCPLHTRWVHSKAQAPPLPAPRDGAEEGRYYLKLCFGVAVAEDTGGDSEFLFPASPRAFAGAGGGGPPRWPLSVRAPLGPRADAGAPLSSRQQRLFAPARRWGAAGRR